MHREMIQCSKMDPHIYGQLAFNTDAEVIHWGKGQYFVFSTNRTGTTGYPYANKTKQKKPQLNPYLTTYTKNYLAHS